MRLNFAGFRLRRNLHWESGEKFKRDAPELWDFAFGETLHWAVIKFSAMRLNFASFDEAKLALEKIRKV